MNRTITVRGTGTVHLQPDRTVISLQLRSLDLDYETAMQAASDQIAKLQAALEGVGFAAEALKTTAFHVTAEHEGRQDENGHYRNYFVGYACSHALRLEFDFDTAQLSATLSAIAASVAEPELEIQFTVRDQNAVNEALLKSAAENARARAEILTAAAGVRLGTLTAIDYSWGELNIVSPTEYRMEKRCMAMNAADMAITPDEITVSDSATFVWELA